MTHHTIRIAIGLLFTITLSITSGSVQAQSPDYPNTRRVDQVDHLHNVSVADPYRWLEDMDGAEVMKWVHAQDDLTKGFVEGVPERKRLASRLREMQTYESIWLPQRGGDRYFMRVYPAGENAPILHVRDGVDGPSSVLYDTRQDFDPNENPFAGFQPSPDGRYIAVFEGLAQSRWRRIRILDVASGKLLRDNLMGFYSGRGGLSWTRDSKGFYYTRYEEPPAARIMETTVKHSKVFYHRVGAAQTTDWLIFEKPNHPLWLFWPQVTFDDRFLVITEASGPNTRIFVKDLTMPDSEVRAIIDRDEASYTFEGNVGTQFRFNTTLNAPNGRIVAFDIDDPETSQWREIVREDPKAVLASVGEIGGRLILQYTRDAAPEVRVHSLTGDHLYDVELPSIGLLGGFADDPELTETLYRFNNLFDPGSTYSLNVHTGKSRLFSRPTLPFNPDEFELQQVFYTSADGTRVPMFIAHKRGLQKSTSNHVFIYGYGAYKWTAFPWFQPHVLAWMEMGGIYAMPGLRGGGEYGEAWYEAGRGLKKPNTVVDYISAAEYLVREGYTAPGRIVANGGSASGVVAGAALMQRPDLFGAGLIDVPALDLLRYQLFGSGGNWISEYGVADDPEAFETLLTYSPYHNIREGVCYPPVFTTVGNLDDSTAPMHGYKFTAALQHAQGCDNPVLLKVMWGAGHAFNLGITPEQRAETGADQLAFLVRVLNLGPSLDSASASTDGE